jgi:branched-chain amino acid transport system permease protein
MKNNSSNWIFLAAIIVIAALVPMIFGIYYSNVIVLFAIFALYAVSYNLLLGYTGLLSFGHAMFFGGGAYATALALTHIPGFPLLLALLTGGLAAVVLALIVSPLLVRVSGTAFAMLTLAFGQLLYVICLKYREVTGGEDGVGGFPIPPFNIPGIVSFDMTDPLKYYYFAIIVVMLSLFIIWFFTKTPFGQIIVSIRDNANRVDYMGFKVQHSKAIIFIVSGFFAGISGALYAMLQDLVSTDGALTVYMSFFPIMMAFIGGIGSYFGPIYGAAILTIIDEVASAYTEHFELVTGIIFILVVMFAPTGFAGLLAFIKMKWSARSSYQKTAEEVS